jgi:hypothetical protein
MNRKPNRRFERSEREKSKASKKAEKLQVEAEKSEARQPDLDRARFLMDDKCK